MIKPSPIFIGGYMHSGTSMLVKILKQHSQIYAIEPELRLFDGYPRFNSLHRGDKKALEDLIRKLKLTDADSTCVRGNTEPLINETRRLGEMTLETIKLLTLHYGKRYWAEKTPTNVYFVKRIFEFFPTAKVIIIYRDVRNIIASKKLRTLGLSTGRYSKSIQTKRLEKDWNVLSDSFSWIGAIKAQFRAKELYGDKVHVVQYERFVSNPHLEWEHICQFLGVNVERDCLEIKFSNAAIKSNQFNSGIVASETNWNSVLSKEEIKLANFVNRHKLEELDYKVDPSGLLIGVYYLFKDLPGVFKRILKRYRMFSLGYFSVYCRSLLRRI